MALPAISFAPVVIKTSYVVPAAKAFVGVNVAIFPDEVTSPGTTVVPCFTTNVVLLIVEASISILKVAEMSAERSTFVVLSVGAVVLTVGDVSIILSSSFEHPEIKTTDANASDVRNFLVFIMLKVKFIILFFVIIFSQYKDDDTLGGKYYTILKKSCIIHTFWL